MNIVYNPAFMGKKVWIEWETCDRGDTTNHTAEGYIVGWRTASSFILVLSKWNEKIYNISKGECKFFVTEKQHIVKIEDLKNLIRQPLTKEQLTKFDIMDV